MSEQAFIGLSAKRLLRRHGLLSFDALWKVRGELVDEPNRARGGISSVTRLTLTGADGSEQGFYLKRQRDYRIRSPRRPLGESTAAREFQNIALCAQLCIPAPEVGYFAERRKDGELQAILLTRDLTGYAPLDHWFERWDELNYRRQQKLIRASAAIVGTLHARGAVHNSLYPKHVFLKPRADGMGVRFIDLEKLRPYKLSRRRKRDLDALNRHSQAPTRTQRLRFLLSYLGKDRVDAEARDWVRRVLKRSARKSKTNQ